MQSQLLDMYSDASSDLSPTSEYGISQQIATFAVLVSNIPSFNTPLTTQVVGHMNVFSGYGTKLQGSPANYLLDSISSFVQTNERQIAESKKRNTQGNINQYGKRKGSFIINYYCRSFFQVVPMLRDIVKQLAGVSVIGTICGEQPVEINTSSIQMRISRGTLIFHWYYVLILLSYSLFYERTDGIRGIYFS